MGELTPYVILTKFGAWADMVDVGPCDIINMCGLRHDVKMMITITLK